MATKKSVTMNKMIQSQIATDFDRLIVDIAACDDLEALEYYKRMTRYLMGLADYREMTIKAVGYGAFLGSSFKKRFDTKDQAHKYLIKKIIAIHDCDEDEINWEDYSDVGYCRRYWIGDQSFWSSHNDRVATISSVDEDDNELHIIRVYDTPPEVPDGLDYQKPDETAKKLSRLVKENAALKSKLHSLSLKCTFAWEQVSTAKSYVKGAARKSLEEWLKSNKELLHDELIKQGKP